MSQKTSEKPRSRTEDEILDTEFKTPDTTKAKEESLKNEIDDENCTKERATPDSSSKGEATNGERNGNHNQTPSPKRSIQTCSRSRSNTPLIKTPENTKSESSGTKDEIKIVTNETNGVSHETKDEVNGSKEFSDAAEQCVVENGAVETEPISPSHSNSMEMEPLILDKAEEEPITELQFDDNDLDVESDGSPSLFKTRRSQTCNVSTPKPPKIFGDQQEAESKVSVPLEPEDKSGNSTPKKVSSSNDSNLGSSESQPDDNADLNDTSDTYWSVSTDNISTRAVAGSDATRNADFLYQDSGLFEENSYTGSPTQILDTEFKTPDTTKAKEESLKNEIDDENCTKERATPDSSSKGEATNGERNGNHNQTPSPKRSIQTCSRSRSNTPLIKTPEITKSESSGTKDEIKIVTNETNGVSHETKDEVNGSKEFSDAAEQCVVENGAVETEPISPSHSNSVEMEPLILDKAEEEPIPELQFDENDLDVESEGSPSLFKTCRSQTRNVSTPKTPKIFGDQQEAESKASVPLEPEDKSGNSTPKKVSSSNDSNLGSSESQPDDNADLNDTSDTYWSVSTDNISTRVVAGSDATRNVDFSYQDSGSFEENSYTGSPTQILDTEFKTPDTTKAKEESLKNEIDDENCTKEHATPDSSSKGEATSGERNGNHNQTPSPKRSIQTCSRSRSNTPLIKTPENTKSESSGTKDEIKVVTNETNGVSHETKDEVNGSTEFSDAAEQCVVENGAVETEPISPSHSNLVEMEPLILDKDEEEPIPELQFDENDLDVESEGSRNRSQTRNVSTPKTPKIFGDQQEAESKVSVPLEPEDKSGNSIPKKVSSSNDSNLGSSESQPDDNADLNDTSDTYWSEWSVSTDNISTRAVAGSDATRNVDFLYQDSGLFEENSYTGSPTQSFGETLRNLSSRRTIRPIVNENYRRFALKNNLDVKRDVYADCESVQRISKGIKRKNRSISPGESKRPKKDTPGLLSYVSNPISNFKSTFSKSSTPKLIAYEEKRSGFDEDEDVDKIRLEVGSKDEEEKKWCPIM